MKQVSQELFNSIITKTGATEGNMPGHYYANGLLVAQDYKGSDLQGSSPAGFYISRRYTGERFPSKRVA